MRSVRSDSKIEETGIYSIGLNVLSLIMDLKVEALKLFGGQTYPMVARKQHLGILMRQHGIQTKMIL